MGVPTSEVHKNMWGHWGGKKTLKMNSADADELLVSFATVHCEPPLDFHNWWAQIARALSHLSLPQATMDLKLINYKRSRG